MNYKTVIQIICRNFLKRRRASFYTGCRGKGISVAGRCGFMDGQRTESFSVYRSDDGRTVSLSGKNVSYGYSWISAIYGDDPGGEKRRRAGSET